MKTWMWFALAGLATYVGLAVLSFLRMGNHSNDPDYRKKDQDHGRTR